MATNLEIIAPLSDAEKRHLLAKYKAGDMYLDDCHWECEGKL